MDSEFGSEASPAPGSGSDARPRSANHDATDQLAAMWTTLLQLRESVVQLMCAKTDHFKLAVRRVLVAIALALFACVGLVALLVSGVVLFALGVAEGLTSLLASAWIGHALGGLVILLLIVLGAYAAPRVIARTSERRTRSKYAAMQERRSSLGPDISESAPIAG